MSHTKHRFVYAVCGDLHVKRVNLSLDFLKRFSRQDILVVAARADARIDHDQVIRIEIDPAFDNRQASILLKTNLHRLTGAAGACCYIDSDVVAVSPEVDSIFQMKSGPVTFSADHGRMRLFSRWAVTCACGMNECDHLRTAIHEKFSVEVDDPNWQHWNGGVFLFDVAGPGRLLRLSSFPLPRYNRVERRANRVGESPLFCWPSTTWQPCGKL